MLLKKEKFSIDFKDTIIEITNRYSLFDLDNHAVQVFLEYIIKL